MPRDEARTDGAAEVLASADRDGRRDGDRAPQRHHPSRPKPGNVMLTKAGAVILDFGLARIVRDSRRRRRGADGDRVADRAGRILGTLQDTAPEQIEGRPTEPRTDVFAFGAMLFEMLTSRKAFEGSSAPAVMGATSRRRAVGGGRGADTAGECRSCGPGVSGEDPADWIASMQDVKVMVGWIEEDVSGPVSDRPVASAHRRARGVRWWWSHAAATSVVLAGESPTDVDCARGASSFQLRYNIPLPPTLRFWRSSALSRDGRRLAVVTQPASGPQRSAAVDSRPTR